MEDTTKVPNSNKIYPLNEENRIDLDRHYTLPLHYGNEYYYEVAPYAFQNITKDIADNNKSIIKEEIDKTITGLIKDDNFIQWMKVINTEDVDNEIDATFERDYADNFGKIMVENLGHGKVNLLHNPNKTRADIIAKGYNVAPNVQSILYPQFGLFWNTFFNRYYAIWYTPINKNNEVLSKSYVQNYINQLSHTTGYIANDTEEIILKYTDELGFSPIDINSISTGHLSNRVKAVKADLELWCDTLNEMQVYYQYLLNLANNPELIKNYIFIDEDKSIFSKYQKTFMIFEIKEDYYGDLDPNINYQQIKYWDKDTDYKAGDIVLGRKTKESKKNHIYRCVNTHEHDGEFHLNVTVKKVIENNVGQYEEIEVKTPQWVKIDSDYAKELYALNKAFGEKNFNRDDWIRFSFPALEDERPLEYYPNGLLKPNGQTGLVLWPFGNENGYTLRPVIHIKEITREGKTEKVTYVNYRNIIQSSLDRDEPQDNYLASDTDWSAELNQSTSSPTDNDITLLNTCKKIVHYFPKKNLPFKFPVIIDAKLQTIKDEAFQHRKDLIKVVFRSTLHKIGTKAFSDCSNLSQVLLPKGLGALGMNAFASCTSLKRVTIPNGVTRLYGTFAGCTNLQTVVLSPRCDTIGTSTFVNCENLTRIYNTDKVIYFGPNAFNNCKSLKQFTINKNVRILPENLFKGCTNCKFDIKAEKIVELGASCFEGCEQITETVSFKDIDKLQPNTYKNCKNLKSINFDFKTIPINNRERNELGIVQNAYVIPHHFCYGCLRLQTANLGKAEQLDDSCFENCAALTEITIPDSVNLMGKNIFYDCFRLGLVHVPNVYVARPGDTDNENLNVAWIESNYIINDLNKYNWVDRLNTRVVSKSGAELYWIL